MRQDDVESLKKPELRAMLNASLEELDRLRPAMARLLKRQDPISAPRHTSHPDDAVPAGWAERHGISVPRADGIFECAAAWVRVRHGVVVGAGLKNRSILMLAVSLGLLDQGAEHHGNLYRDWRAAFLSRLDPGTSGGGGSGDPLAWSKEDRYSKLLHLVKERDYLDAMDAMVAGRPKARHLAAFQHDQAAFVGAFKAVARAMVEVNRQADETLGVRGQQVSVAPGVKRV